MKKIQLILLVFILSKNIFPNVGGRFYQKSMFGIIPDDSSTIIKATTSIICKGLECEFKTIYKTNTSNKIFKGYFFGVRFNKIKVNDEVYNIDSTMITDLDSIISHFSFARSPEFALDSKDYQYFPIQAVIKSDSTFSIAGYLTPEPKRNWGLAVVNEMSSIRHPLFGELQLTEDDYSVIYVLSPIQSFNGLQNVALNFSSENIIPYKRIHYLRETQEVFEIENGITDDSVSFRSIIPESIEYRFRMKEEKINKFSYLNVGGPLANIGYGSKKVKYTIGWEFGINPVQLISILPSINVVFENFNYKNWSVGARLFSMGYSVGIHFSPIKKPEYSVGISFGGIGVEYRGKTFYLQLSL